MLFLLRCIYDTIKQSTFSLNKDSFPTSFVISFVCISIAYNIAIVQWSLCNAQIVFYLNCLSVVELSIICIAHSSAFIFQNIY